MSGNVWEWTETLDNTNNSDDPMKKHYLQMGGSYDNNTRCAVDSSATCVPNDHDGKTCFRICRGSTCN